MPSDLPTTAIGLIAFVVAGAAYLFVRTANEARKTNNEQLLTFMTYIEKKNGNLERTTNKFMETLEDRDLKFSDALIKQGERHQQAMDDLAARLEQSLSKTE